MNILYLINYGIFSVFMVLLLLEGAFAITSLLAYEKYKKRLMRYITPIWEINGTFAVFYIVNFEATFPALLEAGGTIYAVPLLVAAALIIIRNAFLIYGQYIGELKQERKYLRVYALATLIALILVFSVLSSSMSGIGINLAAASASLAMYFNAFNIIVIASALLVSLSLAISLFHIERLERIGWIPLAAGILFLYLGIFLFVKPAMANVGLAMSRIVLLAVFVGVLAVIQAKALKRLYGWAILTVVYGINLLGVLEYPYIFGSLNVNGYMSGSTLVGPIAMITLVGGMIVAVSLSYLVYLSYLRKK